MSILTGITSIEFKSKSSLDIVISAYKNVILYESKNGTIVTNKFPIIIDTSKLNMIDIISDKLERGYINIRVTKKINKMLFTWEKILYNQRIKTTELQEKINKNCPYTTLTINNNKFDIIFNIINVDMIDNPSVFIGFNIKYISNNTFNNFISVVPNIKTFLCVIKRLSGNNHIFKINKYIINKIMMYIYDMEYKIFNTLKNKKFMEFKTMCKSVSNQCPLYVIILTSNTFYLLYR